VKNESDIIEGIESIEFNDEMAKEVLTYLSSGERNKVFESMRLIRQLLARENNCPLDQVVKFGFIPHICSLISSPDLGILHESLWAFTNIVSGDSEYTRICIEHNTVPTLVKLLEHPTPIIKELSAWSLGNIAGDGIAYRNHIFEHNAMDQLMINLKLPEMNVVKTSIWAISNLMRGNPFPVQYIDTLLPYLTYCLSSTTQEVVENALWTISFISDVDESENSRIDLVVKAGLIPKIVELIGSNTEAKVPGIRVIGNVASGTKEQTQEVVKSDLLDLVPELFSDTRRLIRKETAWTLSNIAAGSTKQVQKLIDKDVLSHVIERLNDEECEVVRECGWCIYNFIENSNEEQFEHIMDQKCLDGLADLLTYPDSKVLLVVLQSIEAILYKGDEMNEGGFNPYIEFLEGNESALNAIEELQGHGNEDIYELSNFILENYLGAQVEDIDVEGIMNDKTLQTNLFSFN